MLNLKQSDENIKKALLNKSQDIYPSDNMFENIKSEIKSNRSDKYMSRERFLPFSLNIKKTAIAAASCGFLIVVGAFLASPNLRVSALQSIEKYANGYIDMKHYTQNQVLTKTDLQKDLGYNVKIPASLPEGYKLLDTVIVGHIDGSNPGKQYDNRGANAIYSINKTKETSVTLAVSKISIDGDTPIFKNAKPVKIGNSTTGYFTEYKVHAAPEGVKISSKEEQDIKDGKEVLVGIGSKDKNVNVKETFDTDRALKWKDSGMNYVLTFSSNVSADQACQMAQYIISQ